MDQIETRSALSTEAWAAKQVEVGNFGDVRRSRRLTSMLRALVKSPHSLVSQVFATDAERQAAYDFLHNTAVSVDELTRSFLAATAMETPENSLCLIAVDGVCASFADPDGLRQMGSIGRRSYDKRGLHAMNAVAMNETGRVLGLAGYVCWRRPLERVPSRAHSRSVDERETRYWLQVRAQQRQTWEQFAPSVTRVLLHDSGADSVSVLLDMKAHSTGKEFSVIRVGRDRKLVADPAKGESPLLFQALRGASKGQRKRVSLGAGHGRKARRALMEYRVASVTLDVTLYPSGKHEEVPVNAIWVRERGRVPKGQERLEWWLVTNWPVKSLVQAHRVVEWYLKRWRIEDHHKVWKKSGRDVEATRLRSCAAVQRWMIMQSVASTRIEGLLHLARDPATAEAPATRALSEKELQALRVLRTSAGLDTPENLTVVQALGLIASWGGFTPQRGRRFGAMTLERGLTKVIFAASILSALDPPSKTTTRKKRKQKSSANDQPR